MEGEIFGRCRDKDRRVSDRFRGASFEPSRCVSMGLVFGGIDGLGPFLTGGPAVEVVVKGNRGTLQRFERVY